jgi:hypothetical protein
VVEVAAPGLTIVAVIIDVPQVGHIVLLQIPVRALRDVDEAVLVAARQVEQLDLCPGGRGIGHELAGRLRVGRGGKRTDPREPVGEEQQPRDELEVSRHHAHS